MTRKMVAALALLFMSAPAFAATCKISEYDRLPETAQGDDLPVAREPALVTQTVTYTTSTGSAVFNANTRYVRIVCDAKAHFVFSTAGTNATANSPYLPADTPEYFGLRQPGYLVEFYDGSS